MPRGLRMHLLPADVDVFTHLAARTWLVFDGGGLPFPVLVSVAQRSGRLVCTGLVAGATWTPSPARGRRPPHPSWWSGLPRDGYEVTARSLRGIPVAALLGALAHAAATGVPVTGEYVAAVLELAGPAPAPVRRRPGPAGYPREHFRAVADAYRRAMKTDPAAPWPAFRETLGVSESTARRWVRRARDLGLLGPSTPGRAGERRRGVRK